MAKYCPQCKKEYSDTAVVCENCFEVLLTRTESSTVRKEAQTTAPEKSSRRGTARFGKRIDWFRFIVCGIFLLFVVWLIVFAFYIIFKAFFMTVF